MIGLYRDRCSRCKKVGLLRTPKGICLECIDRAEKKRQRKMELYFYDNLIESVKNGTIKEFREEYGITKTALSEMLGVSINLLIKCEKTDYRSDYLIRKLRAKSKLRDWK